MKLDAKAAAVAGALLWALGVLFVGLVNLARPLYGVAFLQWTASIYPGYHATQTLGDVLTATGYALFDGAVSGWLFAWLYNQVAARNS